MKKLILSIALMLAGASTAAAQGLADDSRLVRSVTVADLVAVSEAEGDSVMEQDQEENQVYATDDETGLTYGLYGTACDDFGNCNGVAMFVVFSDSTLTMEEVNDLNLNYDAVSAWQSGSTLGMSNYLILDGGMTMENIKWYLRVLLSIASQQ